MKGLIKMKFLSILKIILTIAMFISVGAIFAGAGAVEHSSASLGEVAGKIIPASLCALSCFCLIMFCDRIRKGIAAKKHPRTQRIPTRRVSSVRV